MIVVHAPHGVDRSAPYETSEIPHEKQLALDECHIHTCVCVVERVNTDNSTVHCALATVLSNYTILYDYEHEKVNATVRP